MKIEMDKEVNEPKLSLLISVIDDWLKVDLISNFQISDELNKLLVGRVCTQTEM
jgi:hypothetical protein